jgi:hypothetical protein
MVVVGSTTASRGGAATVNDGKIDAGGKERKRSIMVFFIVCEKWIGRSLKESSVMWVSQVGWLSGAKIPFLC